jgi:hypothetical protein
MIELWIKQLREEEQDGECCSIFDNFYCRLTFSNRWIWRPNVEEGYTVKEAYNILTLSN